jgi:hypothetical protein
LPARTSSATSREASPSHKQPPCRSPG